MKKILIMLAVLGVLASCGNNTSTTGNSTTTTNSDTTVVVSPSDATAPTYGSGETRVQVWADFQCPACQSAETTITPVLEELADAGKITIEYRQLPLTRIHPNAFNDALAAMCSYDQGKYQEYKKALYALESQKAGASVSDNDRITLAEATGLDKDVFAECLNSKKYQSYVQESIQTATAQGITGTPSFFLDGKPLQMSPFKTPEQLKTFIEAVADKKTSTTENNSSGEVMVQ